MKNWQRYTMIFDDTYSDVVIDVLDPHGERMKALCTEINGFWSGAEERLHEADGNILIAVLNMLCRRALVEEIANPLGAINTFVTNSAEGWPKLDGSEGIRLVSVDHIDFSNSVSFTYKPTPATETPK